MSNWATIATTKPKEIATISEKIEVETPKEYKPRKSFNTFFRSGILRTEFKHHASKFNQMIFKKSSKYTLQNFELSENDQKQYDHYIKCLPVN